jgi:hypothetical protein
MYEYQYIRLQATGTMSVEFKDRQEVIDRYAAEGWRYAGWIPAILGAYGAIGQIDLVFEREV